MKERELDQKIEEYVVPAYEAPAIEFREPFEVIASTCLPLGIAKETALACNDGPINS